MFDLNEAVRQWRAAMGAQPNIDAADLEEFEDHLREELGNLESQGLSQEEAFLVASRRIGRPEDLNGEFAIADPARRRGFRLRWMIVGALSLMFLWLAAETFSNLGAGAWRFFPGSPNPVFGVFGPGGVSGVFRLLVLVIGVLLVWRLLATDRSSRRFRKMGAGTVVIGSMLLAFLVLAARTSSKAFLAQGLAREEVFAVAVTNEWFSLILLLVLPVLLLVGLWRLVKN